MQIIGKCLSVDEFKKYCAKKKFSPNNPNKLVLHHTYRPDVKDWNGSKTIAGLKKYYEGLGWSNGPHLFIAEDGIWLFTDMAVRGIHAGEGNLNSIGIEVVGDYDGKVWKGKTKENTLSVIEILSEKLGFDFADIFYHRQFSTKTCPGKMITTKWLKEKLEERKKTTPEAPKVEEVVNIPITIEKPAEVIVVPPVTPEPIKLSELPPVPSLTWWQEIILLILNYIKK